MSDSDKTLNRTLANGTPNSMLNNPSTVFRKTHPLEFDLYNDDDQQVLYIEDSPDGQRMYLELHNTAQQAMEIYAPASGNNNASADNYNFALKFRHATLRAEVLPKIKLSSDLQQNWSLACTATSDGTVSLNILSKAKQKIEPDARLKFTLEGLNADARGGARSTRVELHYKNVNYSGDPASLSGTRIQHLSVTNQSGKKNIPLHVGFLGSNTVLNDGQSENEIIVRITNALKDKPILLSQTEGTLSKFILSFDIQDTETKEWALMRAGELASVKVYVKLRDGDDWKVVAQAAGGQGESPEWIITSADMPKLKAGRHIQIKISGIKSALPSGMTNLYVRYENIPGYWDGQFIAMLEKTNLVQRDRYQSNGLYANESFIGVGTSDPKHKLDVKGNLRVSESIYAAGNPLAYENYEIYLRGSGGESSEGENPAILKIANISMNMDSGRGINTVILNPNGTFKNKANHDLYGDANRWNSWADWVNQNAAARDVVAVCSFDAIRDAPGGGSAAALLNSIAATQAFTAVSKPSPAGADNARVPYALLFIKGQPNSMEVCMPYKGANAHIKTSRYSLLNQGVFSGKVAVGTADAGANRLAVFGRLSNDDVSARQHEFQLEIRNGFGSYGTRSVALGLLNNGKGVLQVKECNVGYNDLLLNPVSGNTGVGTSAPLNKLHVVAPGGFGGDNGDGTSQAGNVPIVAQSNSTAIGIINGSGRQAFALNIDNNDGTNGARGVPTFYDRYDGNWRQCISLKNGNVGIGTSNPSGHLEISNAGYKDWIFLRQERSSDAGGFHIHNPYAEGNAAERNRLEIAYRTAAGEDRWEQFVIHGPTGNIGIGKGNPSAPLHVGVNRSMTHSLQDQYAYVSYTWNSSRSNDFRWGLSDRYGGSYTFPNVSICAEGRVVASEFNALSDSRVKSNLSISDSDKDLELLKQLCVTDYTHKDFLVHGNKPVKGFIADEVEEFFPQAVNKRADFIPDIYAFAQETALKDDVLTVNMTDAHNLATGDTVRLITENDGVKEVSVEVSDEKTFSVNDWQGTDGKLFVHGKKVDDCRTLDYQQIFSLGISGIQQLSKEVGELKTENDELKKRLQSLESKMELNANLNARKKTA